MPQRSPRGQFLLVQSIDAGDGEEEAGGRGRWMKRGRGGRCVGGVEVEGEGEGEGEVDDSFLITGTAGSP